MQQELDLPAEFLRPNYKDGSIANVPATVAALLNVPLTGLAPLRSDLWQPLAPGVRRVVLLVVDSLGWQLVERERALFDDLIAGKTAVAGEITSIFPSTTVAALSSLWTGYGPAQHGLIGLRLLMPAHGTLTQFIHFTPVFDKYPDALIEAGLEPETFLDVPGFAEQLAAAGVPTIRFKGKELIGSALSRMHGRGTSENYGVVTAADMFVQMRQLLESRAEERMYVAAYWPTVDKLMHTYGWDHPSVTAEMRAILHQFRAEFLQPLSAAARAGTAVCLVADHGQVNSPSSQYILLRDHPELEQMLLLRPAGEPRVPYFYAQQGRQKDVMAYLEAHFSHAMTPIPASLALAAGLFGPEPYSTAAAGRIGDVIGVMRAGYVFLTDRDHAYAHRMKGRHGSMTRQEMKVPWMAWRLDSPRQIR